MARRLPTPSAAFLVTLGVLLALLHAVLALTASASKSMTAEWEREYQQLRAIEPAFAAYTRVPAQHAILERTASAAQWQQAIKRHDLLRFARLSLFLRVRRPDANIGHSILIYRLIAAEVASATAGSLADWRALVEETVAAKPSPAAFTREKRGVVPPSGVVQFLRHAL